MFVSSVDHTVKLTFVRISVTNNLSDGLRSIIMASVGRMYRLRCVVTHNLTRR